MKKQFLAMFGAGGAGKLVWPEIGQHIDVVVDNDPAKQGQLFFDVPIISPEALQERCPDGIVIASEYEEEITSQLELLGLKHLICDLNVKVVSAFRPDEIAIHFRYGGIEKAPELKTMHLILTSACNIKCRICRDEKTVFKSSSMDRQLLEKIIDDVFDDLTHLRIDSSGELTLYPHLEYVLTEASRRNISIFVSTNGTRIDEKTADLLINSTMESMQVSMDSPDKDTNEWIRKGAAHEDILRGVKLLVDAKKRAGKRLPEIHFHAAILRQNVHQLKDLIQLAYDLGVDGVTFMYGYIHAFMNPDWSIFFDRELCNEKLTEARDHAASLGLFFNSPRMFHDDAGVEPESRRCQYLESWTIVDQNGKVFPCCWTSSGGTNLGDTNQKNLSDIWMDTPYQTLRSTYNTSNPSLDACSRCYLVTGWNPDDYHVHFAPEHWSEVENRLEAVSAPELIAKVR